MILCTLVSFALLYSFSIESIHTGAAYSNCGNIAPLYIIFSASWLSPQLILADLDRAFINLVHLAVIYFICSLNLNLLSIIMRGILAYLLVLVGYCLFICLFFLSFLLLDISKT